MSVPGWYADPGGRPGHYRYWDGQTWSATTSPDPTRAVPARPGPPTPGPGRGRGGRGGLWLALVAAAVVVVLVVGALVLRERRDPVVGSGPVPSSTATGGDDTSPTPSATPTDAAPTPAPSPTAGGTATLRNEPCPVGDPLYRQDHPDDGRVHGGGLSFPGQAGWSVPGPQVTGFSWAYDVGETDVKVEDHWYAGYAVGTESVADGFEDPQSAAELTMECSATSYFYENVVSRTDLVDETTTLDGHPAWTIRSEIRVDDDRTSFDGDVVQVTAVDLGDGESIAFFWGCAPIGDATFVGRLDEVAGQLRVD